MIMRYIIFGTYQGQTEEIDCTDCRATAEYLTREYQIAYGASWRVYWRKLPV